MKIQFKSAINHQQKSDCLVIALKSTAKIAKQVVDLEKSLDGAIGRLQASEQFTAKRGQIATIPAPKGIAAKSLILFGIGDAQKTDAETISVSLVQLAKAIKKSGANDAVCDLSALTNKNDAQTVSRHLVEALGDTCLLYTSDAADE